MRYTEFLAWVLTPIVLFCIVLYGVFGPYADSLNALSVEMFGTLTGVWIALSFSELIKIYDRGATKRKLLVSLLIEIKTITESIEIEDPDIGDLGYPPFPMDMWETAKASGNISLFEISDASTFRAFYFALDFYNELWMKWFESISSSQIDRLKLLEPSMKRNQERLKKLGDKTLLKFKAMFDAKEYFRKKRKKTK